MTDDMTPLRRLRMKNGLKQSDLATLCDVSITTISSWERGIYDIDNRSLKILSDYFHVSVDYLLGRKGKEAPWIPVRGDVAAGIPISAVEDNDPDDYEQIDADKNPNEYFALRIKGDSMEPKISNGDVVIVHRQAIVDNDEIAVVKIDNEVATVKRIRITDKGVWLLPTNPSYEPRFFSVQEVRSLPVTIVGKVVELRAKF